jgi:hypothetical protein
MTTEYKEYEEYKGDKEGEERTQLLAGAGKNLSRSVGLAEGACIGARHLSDNCKLSQA